MHAAIWRDGYTDKNFVIPAASNPLDAADSSEICDPCTGNSMRRSDWLLDNAAGQSCLILLQTKPAKTSAYATRLEIGLAFVATVTTKRLSTYPLQLVIPARSATPRDHVACTTPGIESG